MKVVVTGADGFVGSYLVPRLLAAGHEVIGTRRPGTESASNRLGSWAGEIAWVPLELCDDGSIGAALQGAPDAVVHLAAVASGSEARRDPGQAWEVNATGTARLAEAVAALRAGGRADPLLLVVSTGEVYGAGPREARRETDPLLPQSPYASSKVGAEVAALATWRRTGARVAIARPFAHTGPGQTPQYVIPAFAARLREARRTGARTVPTGNLDPVRDLLDVRDVVEAYVALLARADAGEIYNVARGQGITLREVFRRLAELIGVEVEPEPDPALQRAADVPYLVGDSTKLRSATGWAPAISIDETLRGVVDAQAD